MPQKIVILGAGISGLSSAWYLKRKWGSEVNITLIEKSDRAGGWIQTITNQGFLFEQGPHSCRSRGTGAATLQLIEELGLQKQVTIADPAAHTRYLYIHNELKKCPLGLSFLAKELVPAIWRDWKSTPSSHDESVFDFCKRHLSEALAHYLADPLVSGIYAGDIRKLSIRSCFPLLYDWKQKQGSILRGLWHHQKESPPSSSFIQGIQKSALFSLKKGMQSLITELVKQLEVEMMFHSEARSFDLLSKDIIVELASGKKIRADHVISTLPSPHLNYATVACINLGYRKKVLLKKGFGYLIPHNQNEAILGCIWDSCVFPEQNHTTDETRLTVMLGGSLHPTIENISEKEAIKIALEATERHMGIEASPDAISFKLAKQAIPQYELGHQVWADEVRASLDPRISWIGTAFGSLSVNDCIFKNSDALLF